MTEVQFPRAVVSATCAYPGFMSRLNAREQVKRDAHLVADHWRGFSVSTLADRYQLSERQVRNILKRPPDLEPDADTSVDLLAPLFELLESLAVAIEDYALLTETTGNENVRLGAISRRVDTQLRRFQLMREYGLVPQALPEVRVIDMLRGVLEIVASGPLTDQQRAQLAALTASVPSNDRHWLMRTINRAGSDVAA